MFTFRDGEERSDEQKVVTYDAVVVYGRSEATSYRFFLKIDMRHAIVAARLHLIVLQ